MAGLSGSSPASAGAAIIPRLALGQSAVTICALPPLGGRHIAATGSVGQSSIS